MPKVTNIDELIAELEMQKAELKGDYTNFAYGRYSGLDYAEDLANQIANVETTSVVHGYWIDMQEDDATEGMWRCSVCSSDRYFDIMTPAECGCYYCPNCGAKMDLKSEEAN